MWFSYSDSEMEKEKERTTLDIKWQDDILKDPLSIKDNVKEEERSSLDIKWQDDILKDPLSIKDEGEYIDFLTLVTALSCLVMIHLYKQQCPSILGLKGHF